MKPVGLSQTERLLRHETRHPAPLANKPIECVMEYRCVRCLLKGSRSIAGQPDDGFCPGCRIMGIEGDVPPHDGAALLSQFRRESAVDTDEPIPNELIYRRVAERARAQTIIVSHESSLATAPSKPAFHPFFKFKLTCDP